MAGISQAELARQLGVNKSTITYHVKRGLTHAQIRELIEARRKENPIAEPASPEIGKNAPEEGVAELRKRKTKRLLRRMPFHHLLWMVCRMYGYRELR